MEGVIFPQRDHGLHDPAQFLRLGQGRPDRLVSQERVGHIPQHRQAVAAGAIEFPQTMTMTHDYLSRFSNEVCTLSSRIDSWQDPTNERSSTRRFESCRGPVLQLHAQGQSARSKDFLDLVQRFPAEIRRLEQFRLGPLD